MIENVMVNAYLRRIKKCLRCSKDLRTEFLDGLSQEISGTPGWLEMDQHDLEETFGKPATIGDEFLEELSEEERLKYGRCCKKRKTIIAAFGVCAVIVVAIYMIDLNRGIFSIQPQNPSSILPH